MPPAHHLTALTLALACSALALAGQAHAGRPRGTYRWAGDEIGGVARGHHSNVIFLNRCEGGCVITPGDEDSRHDTSIIPDQTSFIDEFPYGDQAWDALVGCVEEIYAPFDIVITEVDPGSQSHFEAIVAGDPSDLGQPGNVGGIAPFSCGGVINNAISFSFAAVYEDMRALCETVAQETSHAFGLDHELLCEDPMTYLTGCGEKTFRDQDAPCGEDEARPCTCGGSTQNSYAYLAGHFNASGFSPPTVEILEPRDGDLVQAGFFIEVSAGDNVAVAGVAVHVNGALIDEVDGAAGTALYYFLGPAQLPPGEIELRAVVTDDRGDPSEQTIHLVAAASCTSGDGCDGGQVCVGGLCMDGPGEAGGLGAACETGQDCQSRTCGNDGENRYCVARCDDGACPSGFDCVQAGDDDVCWPGDGSSQASEEGGCSAAGGPGGPALLLLAALLRARRRLRRA